MSDSNQGEDDLEKIAAQEQKQFSFETLVAATQDFHPNCKLGQGGFGPVFKVGGMGFCNSISINLCFCPFLFGFGLLVF